MVEQGQRLEVCSDWPDVFRPLKDKITVSPFRRNADINAHYAPRKGVQGTDQFEDVCIAAGIREKVDFRLDWSPSNNVLIQNVRSGGKPVIVVMLPRRPFDRDDGFGVELLPDCSVIQRVIDRIGDRAKFVLVGKGVALHAFDGIDLDLSNRTSVTDVLDVSYVANGFLGYVSFLVPIAESFRKPALLVWSHRGLNASGPRNEFVRRITPRKILHRPSSRFVIDDCSDGELAGAADELLEQVATAERV